MAWTSKRVWMLALGAAPFVVGCPGPEAVTDAGVPGTDAPVAPVDGGPGDDAGPPDLDAGPTGTDAGPGADAGPGSDAGPAASCAGARPTVSAIRGTEGLIIARDGTIYYSQAGAVGRLVPGGTPENAWAPLPGSPGTVWGIALDAANTTLFVGSPSGGGTIFRIDASGATPAVTSFTTAPAAPNGLTIGPDGALYYSDFGDDSVWRVPATGGTPTEVTTSAIGSANGVAFDDDGTLLVCSYSSGRLFRLTLTGGVETARATVAMGLGSPDGVAVDANGDYWVTNNGSGRLLSVRASDGMVTTITTPAIGAAASLDFGAGALDCEDLYVASSGGMFRYEAGTVAGADVLWH